MIVVPFDAGDSSSFQCSTEPPGTAAVVADSAFLDLDAPVTRFTMPDIPSPHHPDLMEWALPSVEGIAVKIEQLVGF